MGTVALLFVVVQPLAGCSNGGSSTAPRCVPFEPMPGYVTCLMDRLPGAEAPRAATEGLAIAALDESLPASVDLRSDIDVTVCLEVEDQAMTSWCQSYAMSTALEALACVACPRRFPVEGDAAVSILHTRWRYFEVDEGPTPVFEQRHLDTGGWLTPIADMYVASGATGETELPTSHDLPTINAAIAGFTPDSFTPIYRPLRAETLPLGAGMVDALRRVLADRHVPVIGVPVVAGTGWDQCGSTPAGNIRFPMGASTDLAMIPSCASGVDPCAVASPCVLGGHAVALVAYDDASRTFTLQNSWSTAWASGGYATIDYDYLEHWMLQAVAMSGMDASLIEGCEAAACEGLSCGDCASTEGCAFCPDTGECIAEDAGTCSVATLASSDQCACNPVGFACMAHWHCCGAGEGSDIACVDGFCEDRRLCAANGEACADGARCCGLAVCAPDLGGSLACCARPGDRCAATADCCGHEQCVDGFCAAQAPGEPCLDSQECEGASFCGDDGVCTF